MKLSMDWLSDFVDTDGIAVKDYCDRMTDTGSKVEGYEILGDDIENVVAGTITHIEKHPDSDHLLICTLECGEEQPRQIVTGAQNVFEGACVPVAKAPAKLPGGVVIKSGKLRGVVSNGMLCSIGELNLTLHEVPYAVEDGILILDREYTPGTDIRDVLKLRDTVVEFEITPNRPDCLSVIGLARETGASYNRKVSYHTPQVKESGDAISAYLDVSVESPLCKRYTARVVKNVKIEPSPLWMRMRLHAAGVRPINNIVDITNYVMLEYGQPMHAFDYKCIDGKKIVVREAEDNEKFISLDDVPHTLSKGMLVISDENKAVALAGVMGGANSEIKDDTSTVVFESACFDGTSVRITSRALGMRTESSGRFEKGLDEENTMGALERACELVEMLGAGEVVGGIIDEYKNPRSQTVLPLEEERINGLLGINLNREQMEDILKSLDFEIKDGMVFVPSWRQDVECMNDLAEEVIRIYGYNNIESTLFSAGVKIGEMHPKKRCRERINDLLVDLGFYECCTFSFISPKYYDKINMSADDPRRNCIVISNPLGEDTSVMRTTLLPSLLEALARNQNYHDRDEVALFENAAVYIPDEDPSKLPAEPAHLALCFYGKGDFYRLKGIIDEILNELYIDGAVYSACRSNPTYHPGRCAELRAGDEVIAVLGELHPSVASNYGFDRPVYAAEIDFEKLFASAGAERKYKPLPKYPSVSRDLAFLCEDELEAGTIEAVMRKAGGKLLESVKLFDIYRGAQVPQGMKSAAFKLSMRAPDHTLTDEEADKIVKKVLTLLERELSIKLRS